MGSFTLRMVSSVWLISGLLRMVLAAISRKTVARFKHLVPNRTVALSSASTTSFPCGAACAICRRTELEPTSTTARTAGFGLWALGFGLIVKSAARERPRAGGKGAEPPSKAQSLKPKAQSQREVHHRRNRVQDLDRPAAVVGVEVDHVGLG